MADYAYGYGYTLFLFQHTIAPPSFSSGHLIKIIDKLRELVILIHATVPSTVAMIDRE